MMQRVTAFWAWVVVILALCWYPKAMMPDERRTANAMFLPHLDKVIHFGVFAVFGFLGGWVFRLPGRSRFWPLVLGGLALAVISELGQMTAFVNRDAGLDDLTADMVGVVVGLWAYAWVAGTVKAPSVETL